MKMTKFIKLSVIVAVLMLGVTACSNTDKDTKDLGQDHETKQEKDKNAEQIDIDNEEIEIVDAHGRVVVPVNPKNVVSLDSRTFETLSDWGIKLAAAPKAVMPSDISYASDDSVLDIGNHREPNLEIIAAADPDLVIIGQRFANFYDDIKEIVPNAVVIDFDIDVSEEASKPGENLVNGIKDGIASLGQIFDKNEEANQLMADFDKAIEKTKAAYNGTDTIMSVVVSGGNIGFSAPQHGRVWGPFYDIFDWTPALEVNSSSSDHQGDDVSVEAIAQSNPDWIMVLDRDASVTSATDALPAEDVIGNAPALQNVRAVLENQLVYAPNDTYTNESIQTFLELFENITEALTK